MVAGRFTSVELSDLLLLLVLLVLVLTAVVLVELVAAVVEVTVGDEPEVTPLLESAFRNRLTTACTLGDFAGGGDTIAESGVGREETDNVNPFFRFKSEVH